jgi:hypothetical protein
MPGRMFTPRTDQRHGLGQALAAADARHGRWTGGSRLDVAGGALVPRAALAPASGGGSKQRGWKQTVVVGSNQRRVPERATCVRTAGLEGVTRDERATGKPRCPSRLGLFALVTVVRQASGIYPQAGGTRPGAAAGARGDGAGVPWAWRSFSRSIAAMRSASARENAAPELCWLSFAANVSTVAISAGNMRTWISSFIVPFTCPGGGTLVTSFSQSSTVCEPSVRIAQHVHACHDR